MEECIYYNITSIVNISLNDTDSNKPCLNGNVTRPPGFTYHSQYGIVILGYTGTTLGGLAIILNMLFLCCICTMKDRASAYNRFIQNLAVCDILGSFTFIVTQNWPQGPFAHIIENQSLSHVWRQGLPYFFRSLPWMFFTAYMLTLNCLTLSQYLASCKPHVYMNMNVKLRMKISLLIVWSFASLQIFIPLIVLASLSGRSDALRKLILISKIEMVLWMLIYISSTVFSIILSILVYCKLRRPSSTVQSQGANAKAKREAFITVSCLCIASIFCRLPLPLVGMLLITIIERKFGPAVMSWTLAFVVLLLYLVFVVDPVIYLLRMPEVRKTLYNGIRFVTKCSKLRKCSGKRSVSYEEVSAVKCNESTALKMSAMSATDGTNTASLSGHQ